MLKTYCPRLDCMKFPIGYDRRNVEIITVIESSAFQGIARRVWLTMLRVCYGHGVKKMSLVAKASKALLQSINVYLCGAFALDLPH